MTNLQLTNVFVQALVPQDQLLVYRVGDGWGSLCEFLGHEVPDGDFPHENKAGTEDTVPGKYVKFSVFSRGNREARMSVMKILTVSSLILGIFSYKKYYC